MRIGDYPWTRQEARDALQPLRHPFAIAIDRAKNPFNIGAIIRTAHSFLVREIFLIGSEPFYERAAMGMQRFENIVEVPDDEAFLDAVAQRGLRVVALEREAPDVSLWQAPFAARDCLLLGNEDDGVRPRLLEAATLRVTIPMFGINHSFPLAISAGIAMNAWCERYYAGGRMRGPCDGYEER